MSANSKEILINVSPQETRLAIVQSGRLQELHIERAKTRGLVGNIYKGKVVRVLPSIQAAFIDIGTDKNAFLHQRDTIVSGSLLSSSKRSDTSLPIEKTLHDGQLMQVQVIKDAVAEKGARLSADISLASRNVVYLPLRQEISLSQKIIEPCKREVLLHSVEQAKQTIGMTGGFIVRTLAESATLSELKNDMHFLHALAEKIKIRSSKLNVPGLVYEELALPLRALRDLVDEQTIKVSLDSSHWYRIVKKFAQDFSLTILDNIEHHTDSSPLFDSHNIEQEIESALAKRVSLKSGGDIVFEKTEAMTIVDVNTGSNVGSGAKSQSRNSNANTALSTNIEAAQELARQLRLRNLGGIIVVDFIDMPTKRQQQQVIESLSAALSQDPLTTSFSGFSQFGLLEITRKRTRKSLQDMMYESCFYCDGRGHVKTAQTVSVEILRDLLHQTSQFLAQAYTIVAAPEVAKVLSEKESGSLEDLQKLIDRPIRVRVDTTYLPHQYNIVTS